MKFNFPGIFSSINFIVAWSNWHIDRIVKTTAISCYCFGENKNRLESRVILRTYETNCAVWWTKTFGSCELFHSTAPNRLYSAYHTTFLVIQNRFAGAVPTYINFWRISKQHKSFVKKCVLIFTFALFKSCDRRKWHYLNINVFTTSNSHRYFVWHIEVVFKDFGKV